MQLSRNIKPCQHKNIQMKMLLIHIKFFLAFWLQILLRDLVECVRILEVCKAKMEIAQGSRGDRYRLFDSRRSCEILFKMFGEICLGVMPNLTLGNFSIHWFSSPMVPWKQGLWILRRRALETKRTWRTIAAASPVTWFSTVNN